MTRIGVGVIGASPGPFSWAAATHIPALRALPGYELRAVSTSRPESARAAESAYGVPAYHDAFRLIALTLRVARVLPFGQAAEARRLLAAGGTRGRLVLDFSPIAS